MKLVDNIFFADSLYYFRFCIIRSSDLFLHVSGYVSEISCCICEVNGFVYGIRYCICELSEIVCELSYCILKICYCKFDLEDVILLLYIIILVIEKSVLERSDFLLKSNYCKK